MSDSDGENERPPRGSQADDEYVAELERYRRRLDGAMFAGDLAWWEMDVETGAVEFHENKADMLRMSPADFEHYEDFTDRLHPDDYEAAMEAMRAHLEGRAEKYDTEYRIETGDGEYRWLHDVGGVTERADDGTPLKVTGVVVDITDRREIASRLSRKNDQLSLLNRIVRHDIRNDMAVVTGWVDILDEDATEEDREALARIRRASEHAIELTKDVRDLMEVIDGQVDDVDLQPVNLGDVVDSEVERVRNSFDEVRVERTGATDVAVAANEMLSSVVGNLLNNAVQHSDREVAHVDVEIEVLSETAVLHVADDGPGIPAAEREAVFRRGTVGVDSDGTGVGLYLVATLVDAYGGAVRIADNEPRGTVFSIELRRARDD